MVTRPLTGAEARLLRWMLENGGPEAKTFLPQLEGARASTRRCPCGCASFDLVIRDGLAPATHIHPIADFFFGNEDNLCGIFVFESDGILRGVEVYGLAGDASKYLPQPEELRPAVFRKTEASSATPPIPPIPRCDR